MRNKHQDHKQVHNVHKLIWHHHKLGRISYLLIMCWKRNRIHRDIVWVMWRHLILVCRVIIEWFRENRRWRRVSIGRREVMILQGIGSIDIVLMWCIIVQRIYIITVQQILWWTVRLVVWLISGQDNYSFNSNNNNSIKNSTQ
mgnify:CR=1 FL=1